MLFVGLGGGGRGCGSGGFLGLGNIGKCTVKLFLHLDFRYISLFCRLVVDSAASLLRGVVVDRFVLLAVWNEWKSITVYYKYKVNHGTINLVHSI